MKRAWKGLAVAALAVVGACVPAPPPGPAPGCGPGWTTAEQANRVMSGSQIVDVRAGVHECFDRLVIDVRGTTAPGYAVRYVDAATGLASGDPIPLRGGAFLEVVAWAPAVDDQGRSTFPRAGRSELVSTAGFPALRQVAWGGYQEGLTLFAVGVQARTTFHVWVLPAPNDTFRLVVDIAHR